MKTLAILMLAPSLLFAQAGSSGMASLKMGVSGRGMAMGDAMSAAATGAAATYYNPAGLPRMDGASAQIMVMHKEWIQDTRTEFLGSSVLLGEESAIGIGLSTTTVSDIEIRTRPGESEGTFTAREYALGLSYAQAFGERLRAGVTARFLYQKIFVDEASGVSADIGAQYMTPLEHLTVGAVLANLGSMSTLRNERTTLPALLRVGPAYDVDLGLSQLDLLAAADLVHIFPEHRSYLNTGAEFVLNKVVAARVGYQFGSEGRGLTSGVGIYHGILQLDYAFTHAAQDLGNSHTISLAITF